MIRVLIVAPTPMMQAGLRAMLTTTDIQVVATASIPTDLPDNDVIIVDETLLEEVAHAMTHHLNATRALVVLTNNEERPLSLLRTLSLHGWSIVPLDATTEQLQASVIAATQGLVTLPATLADRLYAQRPVVGTLNLLDEALTAREREVLELVSQGLANKLIARKLQISEHTVKFHVSSISTKLGASSRTDAVSRGVRRGLITL